MDPSWDERMRRKRSPRVKGFAASESPNRRRSMGCDRHDPHQELCQAGLQPSRILAETNNRLAGQNRGALTVSVFLGILNLRTGLMEYVNGGHEEPLWKASGQDFTPLKSRPCFALAIMENVPYWQQELQLVQGDMLFLYTGGVVRSEDIKGNVYTETYLKQYLDELVKREISLKGIADGLQNDLERFSEGRGQELDRTMVLLRYYG